MHVQTTNQTLLEYFYLSCTLPHYLYLVLVERSVHTNPREAVFRKARTLWFPDIRHSENFNSNALGRCKQGH